MKAKLVFGLCAKIPLLVLCILLPITGFAEDAKPSDDALKEIIKLLPEFKHNKAFYTDYNGYKNALPSLKKKTLYSGSFTVLCEGKNANFVIQGPKLKKWNGAKDCIGFGDKVLRSYEPIKINAKDVFVVIPKDSEDLLPSQRYQVTELQEPLVVDGKSFKYYVCIFGMDSEAPSVLINDDGYSMKSSPYLYNSCITDLNTVAVHNSFKVQKPNLEFPYLLKNGMTPEQILYQFGPPEKVDEYVVGKTSTLFFHYGTEMMFSFKNGKMDAYKK